MANSPDELLMSCTFHQIPLKVLEKVTTKASWKYRCDSLTIKNSQKELRPMKFNRKISKMRPLKIHLWTLGVHKHECEKHRFVQHSYPHPPQYKTPTG